MIKKIGLKGLVLSFALCFVVLAGVGSAAQIKAATTWNCVYGPNHSIGNVGGQYVGSRFYGTAGNHYYGENEFCSIYYYVKLYLMRCHCGYEKIREGEVYRVHMDCGQ